VSAEDLQMTYDLYQSFGNSDDVARRLGISKSAVNRRLQKYHAQFSKFTPPKLPSKSRDIEQLIKDRIEESRRAKNADDARDLIPIPVHIDGPFGLLILGDPHVDDAGCDFELLAEHRRIIKDHPYILGASVGDYQNGWIGRLGALYGEQQTTSKEAWKLVDWLVRDTEIGDSWFNPPYYHPGSSAGRTGFRSVYGHTFGLLKNTSYSGLETQLIYFNSYCKNNYGLTEDETNIVWRKYMKRLYDSYDWIF
jgi:hypothetical protein